MPYYAGIIRRTIPNHPELYNYLVTGGVVYDGSVAGVNNITNGKLFFRLKKIITICLKQPIIVLGCNLCLN